MVVKRKKFPMIGNTVSMYTYFSQFCGLGQKRKEKSFQLQTNNSRFLKVQLLQIYSRSLNTKQDDIKSDEKLNFKSGFIKAD